MSQSQQSPPKQDVQRNLYQFTETLASVLFGQAVTQTLSWLLPVDSSTGFIGVLTIWGIFFGIILSSGLLNPEAARVNRAIKRLNVMVSKYLRVNSNGKDNGNKNSDSAAAAAAVAASSVPVAQQLRLNASPLSLTAPCEAGLLQSGWHISAES